jgi:transcriptional regulator with XRE-family HTH domain
MTATANSVFGTRLKDARLRAGLSQKQLGIVAGLDPFVASTRINRYELGVHKVDFPFASKLADVLKVPVAYFYCDNDELAELVYAFGRASRKDRANLLTVARAIAN